MSFSDMDNVSDVGSEVTEVENKDSDFGDGDGVNDFDETYQEMNAGNKALEYSKGNNMAEVSKEPEHKSDETETVDEIEATEPPELTTDENVDKALEDFEDEETEKAEKTAIFENVSYKQGQNDLGAYGTCGPTSIANSLNRVTGTSDFTENDVLHTAMDHDLCSKSDDPFARGGTTTKDVVTIIDNVKGPESNIQTEVYEYDNALSVEELADRLDDPKTVAMVGVDSATLWDERGDVSGTGLFQNNDAPSDHWITVDSPERDEDGNIIGFNVIDSGGGVDFVDKEKFESMYKGDDNHKVSDPTVIIISNQEKS